MRKLTLSLAFTLIFIASPFYLKALDLKRTTKENIQIENNFFKIEISPQSGGRIKSWFDKKKNIEMALPNGMLDDRGDSALRKYIASILSEDTQRIILKLNAKNNDGLEISKVLTFEENSPVVNVKYTYSNHAQKGISGFKIGTRNFISPGGQSSVSEDDMYYVPTTHTIRRIKGFTLKGADGAVYPPELLTKLKTAVSRPWAAFIDTKERQGFAVSLEDNFYSGWYMWKAHVAKPTFEWVFGDLPAGYSRETEINLIQVNGLSGIVFASPKMLADMNIKLSDKNLSITTSISPLKSMQDCILKTTVRQVGYKWNYNLQDVTLDCTTPFSIKEYDLQVETPSENGLYEISQTIISKGKFLANWAEALPIGDAMTEPIYKMEYREVRAYKPIPGWQADSQISVEADEQAKEDGFMLVSLSGKDKYKRVKAWDIDISKNEFESIPFLFFPFKYINDVAVRIEETTKVNARLRVQVDEEFDATKYGEGIKHSHLLFDKNSFKGDKKTKIWLTVGNGNLKPGKYHFKIKIKAGNSKEISIPVIVNVHDIPMPHRKLVSLESEGYPMSFPKCGLRFEEKRDRDIMGKWFDNMTDHGIDFFQEIGDIKEHCRANNYLKIMGTDISLAQDMKERPEFYKAGKNLPELDFSIMDFYFDPAIAKGLRRFKMAHYDVSKPTPVRKWLYKQAANYLNSKGYSQEDMFVKVLDEQPPNRYPAMAKTAKWLKEECGFRPFSTFHYLFAEPEYLKILNPYFDMYQGGYTNREELTLRIKQGLIDPDDEIGVYTGGGTMTKSYEEQFSHGWNAAFHNHNFFHNHEYMRGGNKRMIANIVYIDENGLPVDSPAFEGLRDGMECANLIALYRQWQDILKNEKEAKELFAILDKRMAKIFGESSEAIIQFKKEIYNSKIFTRKINEITLSDAREAHRELLEVLNSLRNFVLKLGSRYAKVEWSDIVLFDNNKMHVETISINNNKQEKDTANYFVKNFAETLKIPTEKLINKKEKKNVELIFKLEENKKEMPYTYTITKQGDNKIIITGNSQENLELGASNFIKLMKISGVWM